MRLKRVRDGDPMNADDFNGYLTAIETAHSRARSATRLLWLSILITLVDIGLVLL